MRRPILLWVGFAVTHLWLAWIATNAPGYPLGDVNWVYPQWVREGLHGAGWVGIDKPFVYPILALIPMILAHALGEASYTGCWIALVTIADAAAFAVLVGTRPTSRRTITAVGWLVFLIALGPISVGRIDSFAVAPAIAGLVLLATHPRLAPTLLTLAAWVKVWPAALVAAIVIADPRRKRLAGAAIVTSVVIVLVAEILGSGLNVASFVTEQAGRGLQIESSAATPFMLGAAFGGPWTDYYNTSILTYELRGPGVAQVAAVTTPVLVVVVAAILVLAIVALRRGAGVERLLPPLALALVLAMIVTNKVGSPQFVTWLAAPVICGVLLDGLRTRTGFVVPAATALVIALLTQAIYPFYYGGVVGLQAGMVGVLALRNALELALLVWSLVRLAGVIRRPVLDEHRIPVLPEGVVLPGDPLLPKGTAS